MHDGIDSKTRQAVGKVPTIAGAALVKLAPAHVFPVALNEAVEDHRAEAPRGELLAAVGADVAGAACDEDVQM
jgi:hypothetical protein